MCRKVRLMLSHSLIPTFTHTPLTPSSLTPTTKDSSRYTNTSSHHHTLSSPSHLFHSPFPPLPRHHHSPSRISLSPLLTLYQGLIETYQHVIAPLLYPSHPLLTLLSHPSHLIITHLPSFLPTPSYLSHLPLPSTFYEGLIETYQHVIAIFRLKPVQKLTLLLLTVRIAFAPNDAVSGFKLQEYGMPKADIAMISPILLGTSWSLFSSLSFSSSRHHSHFHNSNSYLY